MANVKKSLEDVLNYYKDDRISLNDAVKEIRSITQSDKQQSTLTEHASVVQDKNNDNFGGIMSQRWGDKEF